MVRKYKLKKDETARNSWFDMMTNQFNKYDDEEKGADVFAENGRFFNQDDTLAQADTILKIIDQEINKFHDRDPRRIFLGGVGQGADQAIATFLRYKGKAPLGGLISIFGQNPLSPENMKLTVDQRQILSKTPILWANGDQNLIENSLDIQKTLNYL